MKKILIATCWFLVLCSGCTAARAMPQLDGDWIIPGDDGKTPSAVITFSKASDGSYRGTLTKLFPAPGEEPDPKCVKCQGAKRGQPYLGLEVIWDLRAMGNAMDNAKGNELRGPCMHPDDGAERTCTIKPATDGRSLQFSMRIFALFSVSETWRRP